MLAWPESRLLDDIWNVRIYKAAEGRYQSIDLQNLVFPYWTVSYIAEGCVEVTDGSKSQTAHSGQVMLHAPGLPFHERAGTPGRHQWMLVQAANRYQADLFRLYPIGEVVTLADPDGYSTVFYKLLDAWKREDDCFRELELSGLGLQLVHMLLDSWDKSGRISRSFHTKKNDERLNAVMTYLSSSVEEKITRQTLAELVHLNPNYLDKIFAEKFQQKPMQLLRELRLRRAKRLLENSDGNLSDIASRCGMGDASYLSHQFQKRFGLTPGKYREQFQFTNQTYYQINR